MYLKIVFSIPVPAEAIATAFADIIASKNNVTLTKELSFIDEGEQKEYYLLGQMSKYPYEDIIIGVPQGLENQIVMCNKNSYTELYIKSHTFEGSKYAVGHDNNTTLKALRYIADKIKETVIRN